MLSTAGRLTEYATSAVLSRMCNVLAHRGPDGCGYWVDPDYGLALAHRRLSIIDLSDKAKQPMLSPGERWAISFNGEIYNYQALRRELDASDSSIAWRGHSDTEVLVVALESWGVEETLRKLNGMFALAAWDRQRRRLYLARDPFGEKPLYYGWVGRSFVFGSELKAFRQHPEFAGDIDQEVVASYLRYGYVPHPHSIYRGIRKLPPGCWAAVSSEDEPGHDVTPQAFWRCEEAIGRGLAAPFRGREEEAVEELDRLLRDAISLRMISDVPLGALLSGGIDSSTIVALMQVQSKRKVQTFSIGSREPGYDEAVGAQRVAAHLGTDHTELYIEAAQALAVVPRLPVLYDEPFADSSQIPTFLVSELARSKVTVVLSGDGGDELFAGYNRYFVGANLLRATSWMPCATRRALSNGLTRISPQGWNNLTAQLGWAVPAEMRSRAGEKIHKLAQVLSAGDETSFHEALLSIWPDPQRLLISGARGARLSAEPPPQSLSTFSERAMYLDSRYYLSDDILAKVDRASMGVGLEARVPFLDTRLFEFAWTLPLSMKIRKGQGKYILRRVLERYVPPKLTGRAKQGFAVPVGRWLRSDLRDWGEALLNPRRLKADGYFDEKAVRRCWDEHQVGGRDWETRLWTILMFQAWIDEQSARV